MSRQIQLTYAALRPRAPIAGRTVLDASVTRTRVRPGDLDLYLHVNNGVYLQMMDIARTNLLAELGAFAVLRSQGWYGVVAASTVTYRRSLRLLDPVEITSRVVGWDPRVVYLEQVFTRRGEPAARGIVAARFLSRDGTRIPASTAAQALGSPSESPALPDDVATWARALDVAHRG